MMKNHPFHLVEISPWPILMATSTMSLAMGAINLMHLMNKNLLMMSMMMLMLNLYQWWRDVTRESTFQGIHTTNVQMNMKYGMILFITSEVMFFLSFFWSYFHSGLSPTIEIAMMWPPKNIITFNPLEIPLLNTIVLISSGITITWTHHSIMENNFNQMMSSMMITISLGIYFTIMQGFEYMQSTFTMTDSIYGSTFFMATGFHGMHVIIGTSFLLVNLNRMKMNYISSTHHFSFEAAAWYWHFVDVVWLFLYISIYWWGK
uniref:Cytochrome c oxidase subunit 3 n=1 Tax=Platerodrilus sp. MNCN/DNA:86739 TaxID=1905348 RepID=A0A342Z5E4_9COLE|nr:cytochrome c oxidase subunit III [Platerodrilus sp. MNCN/DNA:86739]